MSRTRGAINKDKLPAELAMSEEQRLALLIDLILETVTAEQAEEACLPA
jgi:hypothetical protein